MASILDLNPDLRRRIAAKNLQQQPSTTAVSRPTPEQAESEMFLQKNPHTNTNFAIADIASAPELNVKNMSPEEYKRLATVFSEINRKYGDPSIVRPNQLDDVLTNTDKHRAFYLPYINNLVLPNKLDSYRTTDSLVNQALDDESAPKRVRAEYAKYRLEPTTYFAELSHSKQFADSPLMSAIRALRGIAFYEDSDNPETGRYAVPGELEHEAHSIIEPKLWQEFKSLYEKKYGKFPDKYDPAKRNPKLVQFLNNYEKEKQEERVKNFKYSPKIQQQSSTTGVSSPVKINLREQPYVDNQILTKLVLGSLDPNNIPKDKAKVTQIQEMLYLADDPTTSFNKYQHSIKTNPETQEYEFDGVYGPGTKKALIDWQKRHK